jgi:hypothetical protein
LTATSFYCDGSSITLDSLQECSNTRCYNHFTSPGIFTNDADLSVSNTIDGYVQETTTPLNFIVNKEQAKKNWQPVLDELDLSSEEKLEWKAEYKEMKLETGRVEMGEESSQEMNVVDAQFESTPFHVVTYQMKPESHKPQTISEVRNYCTGCGYRIRKSSWKFCPKCGEEL